MTALRTIADAMERLGCGRDKIYQLAREGRLELVRFDGRSRITERSLGNLVLTLIENSQK